MVAKNPGDLFINFAHKESRRLHNAMTNNIN